MLHPPWREALERESAYKTLTRQQQYSMVLLLGGLIAAGCAGKTINDILADPQRYANHDIEIVGNVVESFSVVGKGFYRVQDGTGKLWVYSSKGVPRKGARVRVKGKIRDGFDFGSLGEILPLPEPVKERIENGLLMIESSHKAKN